MSASGADKFSFKQRDELDTLIDSFEQDLVSRIDDLIAYANGYADTILSLTSADDDQYVCTRINDMLKERRLRFDDVDSQGT